MKLRNVRLAVYTVFGLTGFVLLLFAFYRLVLPVAAWFVPDLEVAFYDLGVYGAAPTKNYVSFDLLSPRVNRVQWDDQCDRGLVFLTPNGGSVSSPGPMIVDAKGELVWMSDGFGTSTNLRMQQYKGQDYLTFWSGVKQGTMGRGIYRMLDSTYQTAYVVSAVGDNTYGDMHEFTITDAGTALVTVYNVTNMDLSSIGRPVDGWIIDGVLQEIDIATGELLFEWRASDHFGADESDMTHPLAGYSSFIPFDFFHINSAAKDSAGNYLVSSRHTHTVTSISPTGEILWVLGGDRNEFKDLSDGAATNFKWQHDARWISEEDGILTLFDNSEAGVLHVDAPYSQGRMLRLDVKNRTATLLHSYVSLQQTRTPSQGSLQVFPESGNVFIGWGHSPVYSEFSPNGTLLCESHFGATRLDFWGGIVSYRSYKVMDWVGAPEYPPSVEIYGSALYVSWNGATQVTAWELQGSARKEEGFQSLEVIAKNGFESHFTLSPSQSVNYYRVVALDSARQVLGTSEVIEKPRGWALSKSMVVLLLFGGLALGMRILRKIRRGQAKSRPWLGYID